MAVGNPFDDLIPRAAPVQNAQDEAMPKSLGMDGFGVPIPGTMVEGMGVPAVPVVPAPAAAVAQPGGIGDPQQYVEIAKGVIPGAIRSAGTAVSAPDVYAAGVQSGAAERVRERLAMLERAERGEAIPPQEDVAGYAQMSPEQRARAREGLNRIIQQQWVASPTPVQERPFFKMGEAIQDYAKGVLPPAPGYEQAFGRQVGEGLGSVAFGLPIAALTGPVGGLAVFSSMGVGEATQRAVEFDRKERAAGRPGLTQDQITTAGLLGVGPGSTDLLPVEVLLGRLPVPIPQALRRPIAQAIGRVGIQAAIEGVQEGGQGFLQDLIAREVYNPNQPLGEQFRDEAAVGAAVGGLTEVLRQVGAGIVRSAAGRRGGSSAPATTPEASTQPQERREPTLEWPAPPAFETPPAATPESTATTPAPPAPRQRRRQPQAAPPATEANAFADLVPANQNTRIEDQPWVADLARSIVEPAKEPAETVTLYRGEGAGAETDPLRPERAGRWWTVDPDSARGYAGPGGSVYAIDVPLSEATRLNQSRDNPNDFVVPPELRADQRVIERLDALADAQEDLRSDIRDLTPERSAFRPVASPQITSVVTPDGSMEIAAQPEIVELDDLKLAEGSLQPRDRSRAEYAQGARERASRLDPLQLQPSRVSDTGAPVVAPDGTILSGNGRTMSIAEVYGNPALADRAESYRASLGPAAAGMRQPVMIMRTAPMGAQQATAFADLSNRGRIAQMSATERAMRDAQAMGADGVALYQGGEFTSPQNRQFLENFMQRAVTSAEMPSISRNGELTQEGAARMRGAVLAAAYGDADVLARMLESADDNIRSITGGMLDAAPAMARLRAAIASGETSPDMDATASLVNAVKTISDLRSRRVPVQQWLAQSDAFGRDPLTESWVKSFYYDETNQPRRREKVALLLNDYATEAIQHRPGGLFADETTTADVLAVARRKNDDQTLFPAVGGVGQGVRQGRNADGRRAHDPSVQGSGEILAAIGAAPSRIEWEAREILNDARSLEAEMKRSGASPAEIADTFNRRYGAAVTPEQVETGNVWWRHLRGEQHFTDSVDRGNQTHLIPEYAMEQAIADRPMTEGEAAPIDLSARPSVPARMSGVAQSAEQPSPGPRLTPELRDMAISMADRGLAPKAIAEQLTKQFGAYVRPTLVEQAIAQARGEADASRRSQSAAAGRLAWHQSPEQRQIRSERMRQMMERPGYREKQSERMRQIMARPEMQEWLKERGRQLAREKGRTVWTPAMVERIGQPDLRAKTSAEIKAVLNREFPDDSVGLTANAVRQKRAELGYQYDGDRYLSSSPLTDGMRARLATPEYRQLTTEQAASALKAEFGDDAARVTSVTIQGLRAGNPSLAYTGRKGTPKGFQWSVDADNRLAELVQSAPNFAERASILNSEFGGGLTPKAVQRRWEKIRDRVLRQQGDEPMFAVGGWTPKDWVDWIKGNPDAGREDATPGSGDPAQSGASPATGQPGTDQSGDRSSQGDASRRKSGVVGSFKVRDLVGRIVDAPPNSQGLRQQYVFLHPPKAYFPDVSSSKTTLRILDGVPNWTAKAHVLEIEPGIWQVQSYRIRKAKEDIGSDFLWALQEQMGGEVRAPEVMPANAYDMWRRWEMEGSRWSVSSVDGYTEHKGVFYSPDALRTMRDVVGEVAKTAPTAKERNDARREYNELSDLVEKLPPEDDGILAAIGAAQTGTTPDEAARQRAREVLKTWWPTDDRLYIDRDIEGLIGAGKVVTGQANVPVADIKPIQNEISVARVRNLLSDIAYGLPIYPIEVAIAKDGTPFVLDGHHRWYAAKLAGVPELAANVRDASTGGLRLPADDGSAFFAASSGLDMSPEARKARAEAMGFDTSRVLYHGTGKVFDAFDPGTRGNGSRRSIYLTDNPEIAEIYANSANYGLRGGGNPQIIPVYVKAQKPIIVSDKGPDGSFGWVSDNLSTALGVPHPPAGKYATLYDEARRQGYDIVIIEDMTDLGGNQTQYIPLDPANIRSVNAAFDPAQEASANLMAAVNGEIGAKRDAAMRARAAQSFANGKVVRIDPDVVAEALDSIEQFSGMFPQGTPVGTVESIAPYKNFPTAGMVRVTFKLADGSTAYSNQRWSSIAGVRNGLWPATTDDGRSIGVVGFFRFDFTGYTSQVFRGELGHENVHALRRGGHLGDLIIGRLARHSDDLRVMDMGLRSFMEATGHPNAGFAVDNESLAKIYNRLYAGQPDIKERITQEKAAHLTELYNAGAVDVDPEIAAILDSILDGSIWRGTQEGDAAASLDVRPMDDLSLHEIAQANFDTPYAIDPVENVSIASLRGGAYREQKVPPLVEAIRQNGWIEPLVIDQDGNVIEGQHRLRALAEIGAQTVPVHRIRERVPAKLVSAMEKAASIAGAGRAHAKQIAEHLAEIIDKEGVAAINDYEAPRGFEKAWEAASAAAKQGNLELMGAARESAMQYPMAPRSEWYGEANFRQTGGVMRMMTPDEFLKSARPMKMDEAARENVDDLKEHIENGGVLDPLQLYANGKEDGRHRAIAAKELGIAQVPVIVFDKAKQSMGTPYDGDTDLLAATQKGKTRLAALHNLSAENLAFADKMGGIAVPSIGVVKEGMGIEGFGEITLIGRKDLGDPAKNPVFDADAYSVRFPRPDYKAVPSKKAQKLIDDLRHYGIEFDDTGSPQEVWDYMVNRPQPDEAVRKMLRSEAAQAMFLDKVKGKPIKPVMRNAEVSMRNPWLRMPAMQEFIAANPNFRDYRHDDPKYREMSDAIRRAQDEFIALETKGDPATTAILRDAYDSDFGEDGRFFYGKTTFFHSDMNKIGKKEVDPGPTRDRLERAIKPHKAQFEAWVNDTIVPMYGEPRIKVGGRMEPYTIENITGVMTAPRDIRSQEGTMTFGAGNARAQASVRIGDLNEARNRAEWQIATKEDVVEQRKKADEVLDAWRNDVAKYYKWKDHRGNVDIFHAYDASMRALGAAAKSKTMSADGLRRALAKEDFVNVPSHVLEQGIEAGKALTDAPVPYFEGKPQRTVSINEFAGAVIPSNASAETKALLDKHGIPYKTYNRNQDGAQEKVAAKFTQELAKKGEDTLFAIQRQRLRDQDSLGYYSHALEVARDLKQSRGTPEQMLAQLRSAGVKQAEIEATGLDKFLASKQPSLTELSQHISRHVGKMAETIKQELQKPAPRLSRKNSRGLTVLLTKSPDGAGDFRITRFQDGEPVGHSDFKVDERSIRTAAQEMAGPAGEPPVSITRDEIVAHLEANRVGLNEVGYAGAESENRLEIVGRPWKDTDEDGNVTTSQTVYFNDQEYTAHYDEDAGNAWAEGPNGEMIPGTGRVNRQTLDDAFEGIREFARKQSVPDDAAGPTKWSSYSLDPSSPTYRETVLHLPSFDTPFREARKPIQVEFNRLQDRHSGRGDPLNDTETARMEQLREMLNDNVKNSNEARKADFRQHHFENEPNVVGHMMTSMVKHEGEPVYLIDQIQSDWGQKLRDGGVRDEAKIAELEKQIEEINARWTAYPLFAEMAASAKPLVAAAYPDGMIPPDPRLGLPARRMANEWEGIAALAADNTKDVDMRERASELRLARREAMDEFQAERSRIEAEIKTIKAAAPGNPLVNTTDQWVNTTLRRAIRQAAEADADYIAIPHGDTVLSYNPGDENGMRGFYGSRTSEGIVPKNLRKLLEKLDKDAAKPVKVDQVETPTKGMAGSGFTLFPLTDKVKQAILDDGQPLFAFGGLTSPGADINAYTDAVVMAKRGASPKEIWDATNWFKRNGRWLYETDEPDEIKTVADARIHAERQQMTPDQRRATPPWETPVSQAARRASGGSVDVPMFDTGSIEQAMAIIRRSRMN